KGEGRRVNDGAPVTLTLRRRGMSHAEIAPALAAAAALPVPAVGPARGPRPGPGADLLPLPELQDPLEPRPGPRAPAATPARRLPRPGPHLAAGRQRPPRAAVLQVHDRPRRPLLVHGADARPGRPFLPRHPRRRPAQFESPHRHAEE